AYEPGAGAGGRYRLPGGRSASRIPLRLAGARGVVAGGGRLPLRIAAGAAAAAGPTGIGGMSFVEGIRRRARDRRRRIVLPEGGDDRTLAAAARLAEEGLAEPIVLAPEGAVDRSTLPGTV